MALNKNLTVLSFGGGQDSTAILLKLIYNKTFRKKYAPDHLIVVMSDTGNEHPYTYKHVEIMRRLCEKNSIPFFFLTSDQGYHAPSWPNLIDPQIRPKSSKHKATLVQLGMKSCTDKLKIVPIYKFLDEYVNEQYEYGYKVQEVRGCRKKALLRYFEEHGHLRVLIGYAKGEEGRAERAMKLQEKQRKNTRGWQHIIDRQFPLIDIAMNREACVKYIEKNVPYEVMPSNCMLCPYQSLAELLWLARYDPTMFGLWATMEAKKIARYKHLEGTTTPTGKPFKNFGVYSSVKLLPQRLEDAQEKYGHLSKEELHRHKKFHGCQTNNF